MSAGRCLPDLCQCRVACNPLHSGEACSGYRAVRGASAAATPGRGGVSGLILSRAVSVVSVIVSVLVRLPPARVSRRGTISRSAVAGWVAMAAAFNKRQSLGRFLQSDFLHVFRLAWPNDLNRPPPLAVRPNDLVLGFAFRHASRLLWGGYRDPLLFSQPLGHKDFLFGACEDLSEAFTLDDVMVGL